MANKRKLVTSSLTALLMAAASSVLIGMNRSKSRISGEIDDLLAGNVATNRAVVTEADLAALPEPVQRWLRWSGVIGKPIPSTVRTHQIGEFRLKEGQSWMPFIAEQWYTTDPPGFLWSVSMKMNPLVRVIGRDRYVHASGEIDMRIAGLIPVARKRGGNLNQGALLRYLNEIMWFPAAALRPYITWTAIDLSSAKATMIDGGITVEAIFSFDQQGRITTMTALRENDAKGQRLPWSTPLTAYGEFGDIRIPTEGTGVWQYEMGEFPYIRLRITGIEYDVSTQAR